jgi:Tol biopolymer transport system component
MTLSAGSRLGPYEIQTPLGAGGMGEVYKATDTRLDRTVAIKVLPAQWAGSSDMLQRFEREAQTLASLNHPHICVLHDIGRLRVFDAPAGQGPGAASASTPGREVDYLVLEYLEGETLAARIERGALPLDEALTMGIEIADALDKAHRRGVIHRDLKPSNVMLTKSGTKLLDFGLAKWATPGKFSSTSDSPTTLKTGTDLTSPGMVIGTLQYMAPEQLEGLEADPRTDIFSFGVLLHEAMTGKKAFAGKSRVLLISAIATTHPPPVSSVQTTAPSALDHVINVCLAKDQADRWQTATDLLAELEWIAEGGTETDTPAGASVATATSRRTWLTRSAFAGAALVAGGIVASAFLSLTPEPPGEALRFRVPIQLGADTATAGGRGPNPGAPQGSRGVSGPGVFSSANSAIAPDGHAVAFVARQTLQDPWMLYVRSIGAVTAQRLAAADQTLPFWSSDSRSIAFVSGGKLRKVEAAGGPPQELCDAVGFRGGAWNRDGVILMGSAQGLLHVTAEGGKPELLTRLAESETGHFWPHFLPDGRHFLYTTWSGTPANRGVVAASLDAPNQRTRVIPIGSSAGYADPGFLVFQRESAVYAQPFDPGRLGVSGEPVRIADQVSNSPDNGLGHFSVARAGALAYFYSTNIDGGQNSPGADLSAWQLSWFSRAGQSIRTVGPEGVIRGVNVSTDTTRVAVHRHDANGGDIIVYEPRGSDLRLTFDASQHNSMPVWSHDSAHIVFASLRNGKWGLYQTLSTRSGSEQSLYESELPIAPMDWSRDGKRIVFWVQDPQNAGDIWVLTLDDKKAAPLIYTPFDEIHPQISPDGNWIAYTDNSKDGRKEIYVQPFPTGSGKYQISTAGGDWPRWGAGGKELFFHSIGVPNRPSVDVGPQAFPALLRSATITVNGGVLEPRSPVDVLIFPAINLPHSGGRYFPYAVSPDGQQFLLPQFVPPAAAATSQASIDTYSGLTIALNWAAGVKK